MNAPEVEYREPCRTPARYVPGTYVTHTIELNADGSLTVQPWFVDNRKREVFALSVERRITFSLHHRSPSRSFMRARGHYWTAHVEYPGGRVEHYTDGKELRWLQAARADTVVPFWRPFTRANRWTRPGRRTLGLPGGIEADCLKAALTAYVGGGGGQWYTDHPEVDRRAAARAA